MSETTHVLKRDQQSEQLRVFQGGEVFGQEKLKGRIPAAEAPAPREATAGEEGGASLWQGHVLRGDQTHRVVQPVCVEAKEFEADVPLNNPLQEQEASPEGKEAAREEESDSGRTETEWEEHLKEAVEQARAEGYEAGHDAGYEEGHEEATTTLRADFEEEREALSEDATHLDALWKQHIEESEPMLVELALHLAQALVESPLTASVRRVSEEVITEAVAQLSDTPPVTVTLHPVDFLRLQESGLSERLEEIYDDLQWTSDPNYAEGDWSVSSPEGAVRRLRSEVVETLRRQLDMASEAVSAPGV